MRTRRLSLAIALAAIAWLAAGLDKALALWREARICELMAGPWLPCGPSDGDWVWAAVLGFLPVMLLLLIAVSRWASASAKRAS